MNHYDLFHMARITGSIESGKFWTVERFIYDSYFYAEEHITSQEIMDEYVKLLNKKSISVVVYNHCVDIMSGRAHPMLN